MAGEQATGGAATRARVEPITAEDADAVGAFLAETFRTGEAADDIPADRWARNIRGPWSTGENRHGYQLRAGDGRVVGAYVAYYSPPRACSSGAVRFCNLADWAVAEDFRAQSLPLAMKLLREPGVVHTDFTARAEVAEVNRRLGFTEIETRPFLVPHVPLPSRAARIVRDPGRIAAVLTGPARQAYQDHRDIDGLEHLAVLARGRASHLAYRRRSVPLRALGGRRLPVACLLHVSDRELLRRAWGRVAAHLLARGLPLSWSEERVTGFRPRGARSSDAFAAPRMYRGDAVAEDEIDYLYSELMFG